MSCSVATSEMDRARLRSMPYFLPMRSPEVTGDVRNVIARGLQWPWPSLTVSACAILVVVGGGLLGVAEGPDSPTDVTATARTASVDGRVTGQGATRNGTPSPGRKNPSAPSSVTPTPTAGSSSTSPAGSTTAPTTTAPTTTAPVTPSAPPSPTTPPPAEIDPTPGTGGGWQEVFRDDFTGPSLGPDWRAYTGAPSNDPYTYWDPSHVSLQDGSLVLTATSADLQHWTAGGVAHTSAQTYGKWEMRYRVERSDEVRYAALLWPRPDAWPPEIDFAEDLGGARDSITTTLHYGSDNTMVWRTLAGDFTQWHTAGVEWEPGLLTYTMDGQPWATVASSEVPAIDMAFAVQLHGGGCSWSHQCPVAGTPSSTRLEVDWVAVYQRP